MKKVFWRLKDSKKWHVGFIARRLGGKIFIADHNGAPEMGWVCYDRVDLEIEDHK